MTNLLIGSDGIWADFGLLLLRVGLFAIFFTHSLPKIRKAAEMAEGLGTSKLIVLILGLAEMVTSILMLIGFSTSIAALIIAVVMLGAIFMKIFKWKTGFKESNKVGWEFDFVLLLIATAIFLMGPGAVAIQPYMLF